MNEATHDPSAPAPRPLDDPRQRQQRNLLIGLSIGSAIVLFLGVVAVLLTRGDDDERVGVATTPTTVSAPSTSTTSPPTTSTTTTSTTTTEPPPRTGLADAGPDLSVDVGEIVTLEAVALTDGAADADVTWVQTNGPDVTAGVGALGGRAVSFAAPNAVLALTFDLVVSAPGSDEAVDTINVRVFEQADAALFVDGEMGDDESADGSAFAPYRTIGAAAAAATDGADVYVRSGPTYVESETLRLGPGTSVYGGFVEEWFRDVGQRTLVDAAPRSIEIAGGGDQRLSALEVVGRDAEPGGDAVVVRIADGGIVTIADSRLVAGAAGDGGLDDDGAVTPAGVSVGVFASDTEEVRVERSTVGSGAGGAGASPGAVDARGAADDGSDGNGVQGGTGASGDGPRRGGDAGRGGTSGAGDDATGVAGGAGGADPLEDGEPGAGGAGGDGGRGGDGGVGVVAGSGPVPVGAPGASGEVGSPGVGGGGGGGGAAGVGLVLATGGGGGGGGAGADGGRVSGGGGGGGGSVGIAAFGVERVVVEESLVAAGLGGSGAPGAAGGAGGVGGNGGAGVEGGEQIAVAGDGGGGGGGGAGGSAGAAGGGAGGPSFGMFTDEVGEVVVTDSTVRGGGGGAGSNGGAGGRAGGRGSDGSGRSGGAGGASATGERADSGAGATGGASSGWFDAGSASRSLEREDFVEGTAGPGGSGSTPGDDGLETTSTSG